MAEKGKNRKLIILLILSLVALCFLIMVKDEKKKEKINSGLSVEEMKRLAAIDEDLCTNEMVLSIKAAGKMPSFISGLETEYDRYFTEMTEDMLLTVSEWGIQENDKLSDYKVSAQIYLDEYYEGMKADSKEFSELVIYMFETMDEFTMSMERKAKEDNGFAKFYFYASIYYNALCVGRVNLANYSLAEELLDMTAGESIGWVAQKSFQENRLDDFLEEFSREINNLSED